MGRITRAKAAEVAEKLHIDEDAVLELPSDTIDPAICTPSMAEQRPALGELEPNSAGSTQTDIYLDTKLKKTTRGKRGGKSGKETNDDNRALSASVSTESLLAPTPEVMADEVGVAGSPASKAASDDLVKDLPELEMSHLPGHDIRPQSHPSSAVMMTRGQLRQARSDEELVKVEAVAALPPQPISQQDFQGLPNHCDELAETMPNYLQTLQSGQDGHEQSAAVSDGPTSGALGLDQSTYDILEAAAVEAQTTPKSDRMVFAKDDAITGMDALDDAVEQVSAEVPEVQPSPQKTKPRKSSAPVVRMSKAAQARISLAQGKEIAKTPAFNQSRASIAGFAQPKRVASASSEGAGGETTEKKDSVIPHSKPRPMSIQFPTPPPPPKSTKAPTHSTFRLPGEEVAAKLKAAKEARLAREVEEQTKKVFKARPAPTATKVPAVRQTSTIKARESMAGGEDPKPKTFKARPAPTFTKAPEVRQTSASKARMSLMSGKPTVTTSAGVHKRANSVAVGRPSLAARPSNFKTSDAPATSVNVSKRPATAMASMSKPRTTVVSSAAPSAKPKAAVTTSERPNYLSSSTRVNGVSAASKGKEVFNRTANAKASADQQKREKEEAAKKARAEAAERSRQLSREWAEKQKLKKSGVKADPKTKENVATIASTSANGKTAINGEAAVEA